MTSPSLRKRPTTRPSTPRSRCAEGLFRALAICSIAAWAATAASAAPPAREGSVLLASKHKVRAPAVSADAADPFLDDEPAAEATPAAKPRRRASAAQDTGSEPVASRSTKSRPRHHPGRPVVRQVNFEQDEIGLEPEQQPAEFVRPLRKIGQITPYYDYEPDPEIAAQDRCYNLCPRPKDADCPDCRQPGGEGAENGLICPDCPPEKDVRRINLQPGEPDRQYVPRNFEFVHYAWEPTGLYHYPIYFEDFPLERYGHTRHYLIQPFFSGAKFAVQFLGLPYQLTLNPPLTKQYTLGYYRPGEYVPCKYYQIPWNARAALVEAGIVTGAYFLWAPGVGP